MFAFNPKLPRYTDIVASLDGLIGLRSDKLTSLTTKKTESNFHRSRSPAPWMLPLGDGTLLIWQIRAEYK